MANHKLSISQFVQFMSIVTKHKVEAPEKVGNAIRPIIEDIIYDITQTGEIVTTRIYEALSNTLRINSVDIAKAIVQDYVLWLKSNKANLVSESTSVEDKWIDIDLDETELFTEITEAGARAPKLTGKALKKRSSKAEVMSKLNNNEQFKIAKQKLLAIATREARKIAKESGINPNSVDVSKIIVRKGE